MVRQVKVSNFAEVQGIVSAAAKCYNEVGVHDMKGSIADAKSILGMMSLDYSHPVKIVWPFWDDCPVFLLLGGRFCPHTVLAMGGQTRYNVFTLPFAGGARAAN